MKDLKIFLSSTFEDLRDLRSQVIKFLGVFESELISMELFGSSEIGPKEYALNELRKSNLFIGIYAERYGSIDPESGFSITELEYIEAKKLLNKQRIKDILIYILDRKAYWPINRIDRNTENIEKLDLFKKSLMKHTVTFFKSEEELPFIILRDIIRKIGIGVHENSKKESSKLELLESLSNPIGMEFYHPNQSNYFFGRSNEIQQLTNQIIKFNFSLLIGLSGIGKTSLLNAGLIPEFIRLKWLTAYLRPLKDPINNFKKQLWGQLMIGNAPSDLDFFETLNSIMAVHSDSKIIIIIDQFEDILNLKSEEDFENVVTNLTNIFGSNHNNLRILISYRGDVEAKIGKCWQVISGSPDGLPRFYVGSLTKQACQEIITNTLDEFNKQIDQSLLEQIVSDLYEESILDGYDGVYPPFIQMLLSRIYNVKVRDYKYEDYSRAGKIKKIIADYLILQLKYLDNERKKAERILIALVSSYGTKSQKTLTEIAIESGVSSTLCSDILEILIKLRLVRYTEDGYEVSHDYLSKKILDELATDEQKEIKRFKDLLASKAETYSSTKSYLSTTEHLNIYLYREKISITETELRFLIKAHENGSGPIYFWIERNIDYVINNPEVIYMLGGHINLFQRKDVFFQTTRESPELKINYNLKGDIYSNPILKKAVMKCAKGHTMRYILAMDEIAQSYSETFTNRKHVIGLIEHKTKSLKLFGIYLLGYLGRKSDVKFLERKYLNSIKEDKYYIAAVRSIIAILCREELHDEIQKIIMSKTEFTSKHALQYLWNKRRLFSLEFIYKNIMEVNKHKPDVWGDVLELIGKTAKSKDILILKRILLSQDTYFPALDYIVFSITRLGGSGVYNFLFDYFHELKESYEKLTLNLAMTIGSLCDQKLHYDKIKKYIQSEDFWITNVVKSNNVITNNKNISKEEENAFFMRWLVAVSFSKIAKASDFNIALRMLDHNYWTVKNAAVDVIYRVGTPKDMPILCAKIIADHSKETAYMNREESIAAINALDEKIHKTEKVISVIDI